MHGWVRVCFGFWNADKDEADQTKDKEMKLIFNPSNELMISDE